MEMKKVAFTILFVAASLSAVMASHAAAGGVSTATTAAKAPAPATTTTTDVPASAPGPSSGATALGSFIGAALLSFVAYYMQF